jgi:hypothetical protein
MCQNEQEAEALAALTLARIVYAQADCLVNMTYDTGPRQPAVQPVPLPPPLATNYMYDTPLASGGEQLDSQGRPVVSAPAQPFSFLYAPLGIDALVAYPHDPSGQLVNELVH